MRTKGLLIPLMMTLLLAGCGGEKEAKEFENWRWQVTEAGAISLSAEIIWQQPDAAAEYAGEIKRSRGETTVTVTAPETIRGVTFRTSGEGRALEYAGVLLELSPGREDVLSPCAAGELLFRALEEGTLLCTGRAEGYRTAELETSGGEKVALWRTEDGVPVYAEIGRDGAAELIVRISRWESKE